MDFTVAQAAPITVRINGTQYNVPRFLLPDIAVWAGEQRKAVIDEATAHLDADSKARFITYFSPPPSDVASFASWAGSPDGITYILNKQLPKAGVPADVTTMMLANADPQQLRALAVELASATRAEAATEGQNAAGDDPLAGRDAESGDSRTTGATLPPSSPQPTADATRAA